MSRYILFRILNIFPSLLIISIFLFFMSKCTTSDPVDKLLGTLNPGDELIDMNAYAQKYQEMAQRLGLHKPLFYFAIVPSGYPDTLWNIVNLDQRKNYKYLLHNFGSPDKINIYLASLQGFVNRMGNTLNIQSAQAKISGYNLLKQLTAGYTEKQINGLLKKIETSFPSVENETAFIKLKETSQVMMQNSQPLNRIPRLKWFGKDNQYHQWLTQLFSANFGFSLRDGRPVDAKIMEAIRWTFSINGIAIFFSMSISILLGVYLGAYASSQVDRTISTLTYIVYAIPLFWLATLLVMFFTTPEYGKWTDLFPGIGIVRTFEGGDFKNRFFDSLGRLILPILCFVLTLATYLTRQMRSSIKEELAKPYSLLLRAKGLSKNQRIWKYNFPNALFPMITLLSVIIPYSISGSLIIEYIFNIPGMGRLLLDSILFQDWNVVFTIVLLIAFVTMVSILLVDIIYAWLDPRIRLKTDSF